MKVERWNMREINVTFDRWETWKITDDRWKGWKHGTWKEIRDEKKWKEKWNDSFKIVF